MSDGSAPVSSPSPKQPPPATTAGDIAAVVASQPRPSSQPEKKPPTKIRPQQKARHATRTTSASKQSNSRRQPKAPFAKTKRRPKTKEHPAPKPERPIKLKSKKLAALAGVLGLLIILLLAYSFTGSDPQAQELSKLLQSFAKLYPYPGTTRKKHQ